MNKVMDMFELETIKILIDKCPADEVVILCPQWPINMPKYTTEELLNEAPQFDLDEFEDKIGHTVLVSQYSDLVIDVHGIMAD